MATPLALIGDGARSLNLCFRRFLPRARRMPVLVLDLTGRGALELHDRHLPAATYRMRWHDLANRRRPAALFQVGDPEHALPLLERTLAAINKLRGSPLWSKTITWTARLGHELARDGSVGLGTLLRAVSVPELRAAFRVHELDPRQHVALQSLLRDVLRYPSVVAMTDAGTSEPLGGLLQPGSITWIEAHQEHVERYEHDLLTILTDAAVQQAVGRAQAQIPDGSRKPPLAAVLHLLPRWPVGSAVPPWVEETRKQLLHVSVHHAHAGEQPSAHARSWLRTSDVWLVGPFPPGVEWPRGWLTADEQRMLTALGDGQVLSKPQGGGAGIGLQTGRSTLARSCAQRYRVRQALRRDPVRVRQLGSAFDDILIPAADAVGLLKRLADVETLRNAWFRVRKGPSETHGVDRVTIPAFAADLDRELRALANELRGNSYRCRPLRRVYVPKSDGDRRPLGIPCVRDRIVQTAMLNILEPLFEPDFSHFSFAYRPGRGAYQALSVAQRHVRTGNDWAVTADIERCFENIDHDVLLSLMSRRIGDIEFLSLIRHMLRVDVLEFRELSPNVSGLPQGESLSPLLCNVYLDPFDKHLEARKVPFVRYADDILQFVTSEEQAAEAVQEMQSFLSDALGLWFKEDKTNHACVADGVDFLGFTLYPDRVVVSEKALDRALEGVLDVLTQARLDPTPVAALERLDLFVRGFRNYFLLDDEPACAAQMETLDDRTEEIAQQTAPEICQEPTWWGRARFSGAPATASPRLRIPVGGYPSFRGGRPERHPPFAKAAAAAVVDVQPQLFDGEEAEAVGDEEPNDLDENDVIESDRRLFVLQNGSYVSWSRGRLLVKRKKRTLHETPIDDVDMVLLQGYGMSMSVDLQRELADRGVPIVLAPLVGRPVAVVNPAESARAALRLQQVLRRDDEDLLGAGLDMISAKIGNQAAVLRYFSKYRRRTDTAMARMLVGAADEIKEFGRMVRSLTGGGSRLRSHAMGLEGRAASLYWRALSALTPAELEFRGRHRKDKKDAVNQCLDYVYGILYAEVWRAVLLEGLDPYFGVMHGSQRDQGSLVFDLIEEFRAPFGDRLVVGMLGRGLQPKLDRRGLLRARTRRSLARAFMKHWIRPRSWRGARIPAGKILLHQVRSFAKLVRGDESRYRAYRMRW